MELPGSRGRSPGEIVCTVQGWVGGSQVQDSPMLLCLTPQGMISIPPGDPIWCSILLWWARLVNFQRQSAVVLRVEVPLFFFKKKKKSGALRIISQPTPTHL